MTDIRIIDGHNDLAWASREKLEYGVDRLATAVDGLHTSIDRMRAGGMGGQFWSVWVDDNGLRGADQVTATLEQIDFVHRLAAAYPNDLRLAVTASEARRAMEEGKIASLIGIEGGNQIGESMAALRQFARLGARYMTLTWSNSTSWADSATDVAKHGGLTEFGRDVVREMNRIGMVPDLAHVAPSTMRDALEVSSKPVLVTHSCALALCDHPRNVPDDVLAAIGAAGGTVMVAFVPTFVSQERRDWFKAGAEGDAPPVTVAHVADQIEYVRDVAGIDAVGIGADFDGTDAMPEGLGDVAGYPRLMEELRGRGWSDDDLTKLASENVLRTLEASDDNYRAFLQGKATLPTGSAIRAASRSRVLIIVNSKGSGPKRLPGWLEEEGVEPVIIDGADGLPDSLDGFAGMVLLGGGLMPDAYDTAPWLHTERALTQEAIDRDVPTLGICLGGQIIADVAGGEVRENFGPPERGSFAITPTADGSGDPVLGTLGAVAPMIEHHQDMITKLPPAAVLLATSELVENQAFRIGKHVRGLQFHPEASAENVRNWNAEELAAKGEDHAAMLAKAEADEPENLRASRAMIAAFAAEVRSVAR